jgi:hypothetical protein
MACEKREVHCEVLEDGCRRLRIENGSFQEGIPFANEVARAIESTTQSGISEIFSVDLPNTLWAHGAPRKRRKEDSRAVLDALIRIQRPHFEKWRCCLGCERLQLTARCRLHAQQHNAAEKKSARDKRNQAEMVKKEKVDCGEDDM